MTDGGGATKWLTRASAETLGRIGSRLGAFRYLRDRSNAILEYHAVGRPDRYGNVSVERLRRDLEYLTSHFEVVDLPAVCRPGTGKRVALTFDDALDDFYENALPVLCEYEVPATLFVPTAFVDGGPPELSYRFVRSPTEHGRFNDPAAHADAAAPDPGVMSWEQLREVVETGLVTVGNHTATHPDLGQVSDPETLNAEIAVPREELADRLGVTVDRFCFPYGRVSAAASTVVRETHTHSVVSGPGLLFDVPATDRHLLPRLPAPVPEHRLHWELSGIPWRVADLLG